MFHRNGHVTLFRLAAQFPVKGALRFRHWGSVGRVRGCCQTSFGQYSVQPFRVEVGVIPFSWGFHPRLCCRTPPRSWGKRP